MKRSILFLALAAILLSSCFIPDNYDLTIDVQKDGSYTFNYEGEFNYAPAMEAVINGEYDEKAEEDLQEIIEDLKESEGFEKVKDLGKGKIKIEVNATKDDGSDYYFLDKDLRFFSVVNDDEGQLIITGFNVDENSKNEVDKFNTKLKGKLTVTLPKKMKVKSDNADMKIKLDKKKVQYEWYLDVNSEKPEMVIKL